MIEAVFSESACGSLKVARRYGKGNFASSVGVIISGEDDRAPSRKEIREHHKEAEARECRLRENATPLGGNAADVYEFDLALSIGEIAEISFGDRRQHVLEQLFGEDIYPNPKGSPIGQAKWQRARENIERICARAASDEPLRIWYSHQPDELCGLYWLMAQLHQRDAICGPVYVVKLPEWEADDNGNVVQATSWGEVGPGEWHRYLPLQKLAVPVFCKSCAVQWRTLQSENAPLRAVLNGRLVSMPETLYDTFIAREIAAAGEQFQEAMLIGNVIGKHQLGIGDAWIALRIEAMIDAGMLRVATDAAADRSRYRRILQKCVQDAEA